MGAALARLAYPLLFGSRQPPPVVGVKKREVGTLAPGA